MADTNTSPINPATPKNFGGQLIEFIRSVAEQFKLRYTKEESDEKFLSKEDASDTYETKESATETKNTLQSAIDSKADKEYVDNTFITKEGEGSNASSANKLTSPVMINGTLFDGTTNITTEHWGEPRQIQVFDSAERNYTAKIDWDGSTNLKIILPASMYFKDLILDGTITAKNLNITNPPGSEGDSVPVTNIAIINSTTINTNTITSEEIATNTFNSQNITVSGTANLTHVRCVDVEATSFIRGDEIQSTHNYNTSDERLKSDIHKLQLKEYYGFGPCTYKFKHEKKISVGLIAQDVLKEFPEAIYKGKDGYLAIDYSAVVALLCGRINRLEKRVR